MFCLFEKDDEIFTENKKGNTLSDIRTVDERGKYWRLRKEVCSEARVTHRVYGIFSELLQKGLKIILGFLW